MVASPEVRSPSLRWVQYWRWIAVTLIAALVAVTLFPPTLPLGVEWSRTLRASALDLIHGKDPYSNDHFFNPPWTLVPLIPLALLPVQSGRFLFFLFSFGGFAYSARFFRARPVALAAFLLSPPVVECLLSANVDWLPLVGFTLPPQIGLLLVSTKPQIGAGAALFWAVQHWRLGGPRQVFKTFLPLIVLTLASFLWFEAWPVRSLGAFRVGVNLSLFPYLIPVGLVLFVAALRKVRLEFAIASGPCFSPYVELHSWAGALLSLVSLEMETCAAVIGLWIVTFLQAR